MSKPVLCPICQKLAAEPSKTPFCSDRCRKIDFFRWWDGRYAICQSQTEDSAGELGTRLMNFDSDSDEFDLDAQ